MSAPSDLHERRVDLLRELADLSGYSLDVMEYARLRPDVCRLHSHASSIFVAEAKATESSVNGSTQRRLVRYARATRVWTDAGIQVAFAVCHDPGPPGEWCAVLVSCLTAGGRRVARTTYALLDGRNAVSVATIEASDRLSVNEVSLSMLTRTRR